MSSISSLSETLLAYGVTYGGGLLWVCVVFLSVLGLYCLTRPLSRGGSKTAVIHAIGTANPERLLLKSDMQDIVNSMGYPEDLRGKMSRVVEASGIDRRYTASSAPAQEYLKAMQEPGYRGGMWDSTAHVMAIQAARNALATWRHGTAQDITHVVVHSCTGFSAPGLDFELIKALGLRSDTRKLGVNFMGCFGGMTSLYVAKQLIEADTTGRAVVLVACAEVCSVHISSEPKAELGVGNSIFGDGAASAIVTHSGFRGSRGGAVAVDAPIPYPLETPDWEWSIGTMSSEIIADSAGHMTWKQSVDGGRYDMWLAREIPEALLSFFVNNGISLLRKVGLNPYGCAWALHPGGKGILTNFEKGLAKLGIKPEGIECSHDVLANHGNMSSATILFVLQRVLSSTKRDSAFFAAFGPGLTVEYGALNKHKLYPKAT